MPHNDTDAHSEYAIIFNNGKNFVLYKIQDRMYATNLNYPRLHGEVFFRHVQYFRQGNPENSHSSTV